MEIHERRSVVSRVMAPSNNAVTGNVLTLVATNGYFTEVPNVCEDEGTSLSTDRRTLARDLGERTEGTAEYALQA